jgi:hypothetical protein
MMKEAADFVGHRQIKDVGSSAIPRPFGPSANERCYFHGLQSQGDFPALLLSLRVLWRGAPSSDERLVGRLDFDLDVSITLGQMLNFETKF